MTLGLHSNNMYVCVHDSYSSAWIGLSSPDTVTGYVWSDGSPVSVARCRFKNVSAQLCHMTSSFQPIPGQLPALDGWTAKQSKQC